MDKFNTIIYDMTNSAGMKDYKIKNGHCSFDVNGTIIHIKYDEKRNRIMMISEIAELPQTNCSAILRYFLRINGDDESSKGMTFGYNKHTNKITIGYSH